MKSFQSLASQYKGDGPYLYINNIQYIDAASGTFNLPLGYTHERLATKLKQQIDKCIHLSSIYTGEMANSILSKLLEYTPDNVNRIFLRDVSGSGAVECAIRMAQKVTNRSGVISFFSAHHGQSMATAEVSGNAFRIKNFHLSIEGSIKIPTPRSVLAGVDIRHTSQDYPDLEEIIEFGSRENLACLIIEPIIGNGGNIVFPTEFYAYLRDICRKYGIVIIADEVQTGFGRTGDFFASAGYAKELEPDIIVFAKNAGGLGIPIGGVLMKKEFDVLEPFEHSSTSGANMLSLTALNEIIDIIRDEDILQNVKQNSLYLCNGLLELQNKYHDISGVRGVGYMFGFDTPSSQYVSQAITLAAEYGLILRGSRYGRGNTLKIRPPLICTRQHLDEIFVKLDKVFQVMLSSKNKECEKCS